MLGPHEFHWGRVPPARRMRMRGWKMLQVLLVLLFTASTSFAAGFRLPEAGAKAMGMGFAFTAQADDPSAIYFNPAGLTQLKGQNVMVGVTYVRENGGEFTGTTPVDNTLSLIHISEPTRRTPISY